MITEDYISFETAKLLKEKGFDEKCLHYYEDNRHRNEGIEFSNWCNIEYSNSEIGRRFTCPTLQMAMKWLRELHDLIIYVKLVNDGDIYHDAWGFVIYNKFTNKYIKSDKLCFKYEEACDAAVRYCLENLI